MKVGELAGMTDPQINACITNDAALEALNKRVNDSATAAKITRRQRSSSTARR